jgi:magnesium-transporting ATPase (P-type)
MASITGMIPQDSLVLRDGHQKSIPASDLVVGKQYQFQPN